MSPLPPVGPDPEAPTATQKLMPRYPGSHDTPAKVLDALPTFGLLRMTQLEPFHLSTNVLAVVPLELFPTAIQND
jgi:hypothetical protein